MHLHVTIRHTNEKNFVLFLLIYSLNISFLDNCSSAILSVSDLRFGKVLLEIIRKSSWRRPTDQFNLREIWTKSSINKSNNSNRWSRQYEAQPSLTLWWHQWGDKHHYKDVILYQHHSIHLNVKCTSPLHLNIEPSLLWHLFSQVIALPSTISKRQGQNSLSLTWIPMLEGIWRHLFWMRTNPARWSCLKCQSMTEKRIMNMAVLVQMRLLNERQLLSTMKECRENCKTRGNAMGIELEIWCWHISQQGMDH